ncbi:MSCRAMM family protein [Tunturiibacter gelidoferens]|uniref:Uncharacterized protein n=1 Tax=Tunturiibacter gelidiferens TaxID=3069689 RepID=A0ACC5P4G0_9BACT|nr:carboxypeptidase regulatory-like domain-containing protein [Edaphobacter lichenicola]MBB5341723.1 hypothetical protein [Edaphobacter lichenicola]
MTLQRHLLVAAALGLLPGSLLAAQNVLNEPSPPPNGPTLRSEVAPPGYTVTGHVFCGDTQKPARFAEVALVPTHTEGGSGFVRNSVGRTDLEGAFSIGDVPPGQYYVTAQLTGYVNKNSDVQNAVRQGGDALRLLSGIPEIHVAAGGANAELSLQRGGVMTGSVQWDDGTPAAGVFVSVQAPNPASSGSPTSLQQGPDRGIVFLSTGAQTDDRGHFRISGIAPGAYTLRVNLQATIPVRGSPQEFTPTTIVNIYAPNKFRRSDAAIFKVAAGEERADVTVTMALASLHSVAGTISSTGANVHSGSVSMVDQTDSSMARHSMINVDGSFVLPYMPPGNYTLRVNASSNLPRGRGQGLQSDEPEIRFQLLEKPVNVTDSDVTSLNLSVMPVTGTLAQ